MYLFSNVLGVFVFDDKLNKVDEILFKTFEDSQNKKNLIEKMKGRHKGLKEPDGNSIRKIMLYFKSENLLNEFYIKNLELTKFDTRNSVKNDLLLIHSTKSIGEIDKAIDLLVKRLREWYDIYNPEFSRSVDDHEKFVGEILEKEKDELLRQINVEATDSIGASFAPQDIEPIKSLARQICNLYQLRKAQFEYISALMDGLCPNLKAVCDVLVCAKLMEHAGSLKRLSEMPSSTIQVLGAEKALFRHIKTGAKPPRHGLIIAHPLIARAPEKMHGRIARALADKISIASRVDYFNGQFIGDKLRKELEEKYKQ